MRKCAAVVTDEGGLTSHATIVTRELRTPCIVGAQAATQTFADGDPLLVDPTSGIVSKE